jgi:hypothetical protein
MIRAEPERDEAPQTAEILEFTPTVNRPNKRDLAALERELQDLRSAPKGSRNNQLNDTAFNIAQLANDGAFAWAEVERQIIDAARACGLVKDDGLDAVRRTTKSGFYAAKSKPKKQRPLYSEQNRATSNAHEIGIEEPKKAQDRASAKRGREIESQRADRVKIRPVNWLWNLRIPSQTLSIIFGVPGAGKSTLLCGIVGHITTGTDWPDGSVCPQGIVLIVNGEDPKDTVLVPRLMAAGADLSRIELISTIVKDGDERFGLNLRQDLKGIERLVDKTPEAKLLILDPINAFLGGTDAHRDVDIRSVLGPLAELAERRDIAIVMVCHNRKSTEGSPMDLVMGSRGYAGAARSILFVARDPETDAGLMAPVKTQYGKLGCALSFKVDEVRLESEEGTVVTSRTTWTGTSNKDARAILQSMRGADSGSSKDSAIDDAIHFLELTLYNGAVHVRAIKEAASAGAGPSWATIRRAQAKMGIKPYQTNMGWFWALPEKHQCETLTNEDLERLKTPFLEDPDAQTQEVEHLTPKASARKHSNNSKSNDLNRGEHHVGELSIWSQALNQKTGSENSVKHSGASHDRARSRHR